MKITKSELKEMIREALREELSSSQSKVVEAYDEGDTELYVLFSGPSTEDDWPSTIYKIYLADEDQNRFNSGFEAAQAEFWKSYPDEDISLYEILIGCSAANDNKIKAAIGVKVPSTIKKLILNSDYDILTQEFGGDYMNPFTDPDSNPWVKKYLKP